MARPIESWPLLLLLPFVVLLLLFLACLFNYTPDRYSGSQNQQEQKTTTAPVPQSIQIDQGPSQG